MWGLFTSAWVPITRVVKGELSVFVFLKTLISFHEANVSLAVLNLNQLITGFVAWVRALTRKLKLYGSDSCLNSKSIDREAYMTLLDRKIPHLAQLS